MKVDAADAPRPFAYADPRSLSRAWFDALYARPPVDPVAHGSKPEIAASHSCMRVTHARCTARDMLGQATTLPQSPTAACAKRRDVGTLERGDAPRAADRRVVVRAEHSAAPIRERIDIRHTTADGTALRLLLENDADRVRVVAICDENAAERVGDALLRARVALAARGISLQTTLLEPR